jgi:hypothetical protein
MEEGTGGGGVEWRRGRGRIEERTGRGRDGRGEAGMRRRWDMSRMVEWNRMEKGTGGTDGGGNGKEGRREEGSEKRVRWRKEEKRW